MTRAADPLVKEVQQRGVNPLYSDAALTSMLTHACTCHLYDNCLSCQVADRLGVISARLRRATMLMKPFAAPAAPVKLLDLKHYERIREFVKEHPAHGDKGQPSDNRR